MEDAIRASALLTIEINALLVAIALLKREGGRRAEIGMLRAERKRLIAIAQRGELDD